MRGLSFKIEFPLIHLSSRVNKTPELSLQLISFISSTIQCFIALFWTLLSKSIRHPHGGEQTDAAYFNLDILYAMCVCVCSYTYIYVSMCVNASVFSYVFMYLFTYQFVSVCFYVCLNMYMCILCIGNV